MDNITENDIYTAGFMYALQNGLPANKTINIWKSAINWYKEKTK